MGTAQDNMFVHATRLYEILRHFTGGVAQWQLAPPGDACKACHELLWVTVTRIKNGEFY